MGIKIVVLGDGETWDTVADTVTLTDDQYDRLVEGECTVEDLINEGADREEINV